MPNQEDVEFDVIILGAGPAGSTCALALSKSKLRVALLEKNTFPRQKTCGDAVAAYVPKVLGTIDPGLQRQFESFAEKLPVNSCRLFAPNEKYFDLRFEKTGFISRRLDFDNFLFEQVVATNNIAVFENHQITDVSISAHGVNVMTSDNKTFRGKLVIGCDGAHSVINRRITGTRRDPDHHCAAVRAYYRNVTDIPEGTFEIHLLKNILPGYFWIFPEKGEGANVGLGVLSSVVARRKLNLRAIFNEVLTEIPYITDRFRNATQIGPVEGYDLPLGSRKVPISGDRFMLCGDAASLIDPLSGEGIGQAIVSGRYAGWQAMRCFEQDNFSAPFMHSYDRQVYAKFWSRHRKNYFIQRLTNHEWLLNGLFNTVVKNELLKTLISKGLR
jgi:geranylgeranyl reductase family protein